MDEAPRRPTGRILRFAAERFGVSPEVFVPMRGGCLSYVYAYVRDGLCYVLRIIPPNEEITPQSMRATLRWTAYLAANGGPVSALVPSQRGRLLEIYEDSAGEWLVTAAEQAPGILAQELRARQWTPSLCRRLGSAVGRMHALAERYQPSPLYPTRTWEEVGNCFLPLGALDASQHAVQERGEETLRSIRQLGTDPEGYGLVHMDLHLGNIVVGAENGQITLLDFDDCCQGWFMMDSALLLFDAIVLYGDKDADAFAQRFMAPYLRGYATQRSLGRAWLDRLPMFLKAAEYAVYTQAYPGYCAQMADQWVARFMPGRQQRIEEGQPYVNLDLTALESELERGRAA